MLKKFVSLFLAFVLVGCAHGIPYKPPYLFIRLGQADQICARKDGTAFVNVFITRMNMPPGPIHVQVNQQVSRTLYGSTVEVRLEKVGIGRHEIHADAEGVEADKTFSVWECVQ